MMMITDGTWDTKIRNHFPLQPYRAEAYFFDSWALEWIFDTKEDAILQLFQLRLSPEQSGKVEYERERLLGIANKFIHLLAIPSS
jgi:hypothetical protein